MKWLRQLAGLTAPKPVAEERHAEDRLRDGLDCQWLGDLAGAERHWRGIAEADPAHAEAQCLLGNLARWDKRPEEAVALFQKAVELQPGEAVYHFSLGHALLSQRRFAEAADAYQAGLALQPGCTEMRINHVAAMLEDGRREEARIELERLRATAPELWQVHFNLGGIYREYGRIEDAVACYRRCLEVVPDHAPARSNLLLIMNYSTEQNAASILEEHRRFGEQFARRYIPPPADRAWPRRLRIGYLSPDLRGHVVSYFIEPLLANHDRQAFEIFCYHCYPEKDRTTARLRDCADRWLDCEELTDAQLAARIREDRIDILVDLAGHTADNRLLTMAMKPAPVQATYLGYPGSTGLQAIDYHITDAWADPPAEDGLLGAEPKARLPGSYFCYRPVPHAPEAGPSPAQGPGTLTFGCFNNFPKVSSAFVAAAARILAAVPGSRLVMKARPLSVPAVADGVRASFGALGIDPRRLDLRGWEGAYRDHLSIYREVDIALDTFPYNGATTTCEALWMGVPVVTLAGDRHAGRMGNSLLNALGLGELVAADVDDYVAKCAALARDGERLAGLRRGLRERMQRSELRDEAAFARKFEALYREMWGRFLRPENAARDTAAAQSVERLPQSVERLLERVRLCRAEGRLAEADAAARAVLAVRPDHSEALRQLCDIGFEAGTPGAAIEPLLRAIAADGTVASFHYMLGAVLQEQGKLDDAVASLRRALELEPGLAKAHNNLGCIWQDCGRLPEAIDCFRQAASLDPTLAQAHYNLGNACKQAGDLTEAMRSFERALALEPAHADWRCNLAHLQIDRLQLDEAIASLQAALAADPCYSPAHVNLGAALLMAGRVEEALVEFGRARELAPDFVADAWILLARHYREAEDPISHYEAHLACAARHAGGVARMTGHAARRRGPRPRLNVAYDTPDVRWHPEAYILEHLLASHDRDAVRVFCYSTSPGGDEVTVRLRAACDFWRDIAALSDDAAAERVSADGIDILVDLAGYTAGSRPLLFARKPAPIQVGWIGYPNTTGLASMDYRLTDAAADPPGQTEQLYTEELARLKTGFLCYRPAEDAPAVSEPPALRTGAVTFGCFNHLPKLTPSMMALWSALLRERPGSRLMLKSYGLAARSARAALQAGFERLGIGKDRLVLLGPERSTAAHLARYADVDVALDVFPYNGTTTTCEALWMGVPVVSLAGRTHVSRVGASLLAAAGLPQLAVSTPEQYVATALGLADDLQALRRLRLGMRERLRGSALLEAKTFTRGLETEYRRMAEATGLTRPGR